MSLPARVVTLAVAFLAVVAGVVFVAFQFIGAQPPLENYTSYAKDGQVNVTLMSAPQTTTSSKPDWPSFFIKNPSTGSFDHTTYFAVPAGTRVNVTIFGYDGCSALRNPLWGRVAGTIGGTEDVSYVNGKSVTPPAPMSVFDSYANCAVQHTFAIPSLGLNAPVASPTTVKEINNLCGTSPCVAPADESSPHTVVTFSFMSPKTTGTYRWQCFVPCGNGYLDGNGGPMSTPGYMGGQMEVRA